jgi:diguanylate cyclase (GGDEF)-like protein/PAS domain S-box-containing protein
MKDETKAKGRLAEGISTPRRKRPALGKHDAGCKTSVETDQQARSLLTSILESTADGILVVDNHGKVILFNKKFLSLWSIPASLAAKQDDQLLLEYVLGQLKDPGGFIEQVKQLYSRPEGESFDVLEFIDGRVFERFSQPQTLGKDITGRVWSFRDVTDRRWAEEEQRQSQKTAERLAKEMTIIAEIGRQIGSSLDIHEVYERFAAEAKKLIPFDRIAVNVKHPHEDVSNIAYVSGMDITLRRQGVSTPEAGSLTGAVLRARTGQLIQPEATPEGIAEIVSRFPLLSPSFQAGQLSFLCVPLIYRDEAVGVLHFRSKKANAYTERDLQLAERIGAQIAGAIANAQLFYNLKKTENSLRESEGRFRALVEQAAVGVAEVEMSTGRFFTVNRRLCEMVGRTEEELLATTFLAITHPEDLRLHEENTALLSAGKIRHYSLEKRYLRKDGEIVWVNITVSPLWKSGEKPVRTMVVVEDITERKRVQEESERRSRQLTVLHGTSVEVTAELNLNVLLQSIAEHALNLIGGKSCNCYIYKPELDAIERVAIAGEELVLGGKTRRHGEGVVGQVWATGAPLLINDYRTWPGRKKEYDHFPSRALVSVPVRWGDEFLGVLNILAYTPHRYTQADMDILGMFATQAAIAIRNARLYNKIEQVSITDELTGLFNRRGFFQFGEREFERSLRFNRPLSVLMLDIDHFKVINDTYGHSVGDQVLRALADCFRQNKRGIDVEGRYGGEEFVLLLPETLLPGAGHIAERLRQSVAELAIPVSRTNGAPSPVDLHITVSVGVAPLLPEIPGIDGLIDLADQAMYRAKSLGRNRVVVWEK